MQDKINPTYYQAGKCECGRTLQTYDYVIDLPYADATAIKYITRHRVKDGATDIRKAIWFLKAILKDDKSKNLAVLRKLFFYRYGKKL